MSRNIYIYESLLTTSSLTMQLDAIPRHCRGYMAGAAAAARLAVRKRKAGTDGQPSPTHRASQNRAINLRTRTQLQPAGRYRKSSAVREWFRRRSYFVPVRTLPTFNMISKRYSKQPFPYFFQHFSQECPLTLKYSCPVN